MDGWSRGPHMSKAEVTVAWRETEMELLPPRLALTPSSPLLPSSREGVGYLDTAGGQTPEPRQTNAPPAEP